MVHETKESLLQTSPTDASLAHWSMAPKNVTASYQLHQICPASLQIYSYKIQLHRSSTQSFRTPDKWFNISVKYRFINEAVWDSIKL